MKPRIESKKEHGKERNIIEGRTKDENILHETEQIKTKNQKVKNQPSISNRLTMKLPKIKLQKIGG